MKKYIILLGTFICSLSLYSQTEKQNIQEFKLQITGQFLTTEGKDFYVIDCGGKAQNDLYNDFLVAITKLYVSPKTVIDKVENRIITIKGFESPAFSVNTEKKALDGTPIKSSYAVRYTLQFQFKEGRIRVDAPVINAISKLIVGGVPGATYEMPLWVSTEQLFLKENPQLTGKEKKDEKLIEKANRHNRVKENTCKAVNNFVNSIISKIVQDSIKPDKGSDW